MPLTPEQLAALLGTGSAASNTQIVQGKDGISYLVDLTTGVAKPIQGIPGAPPTAGKVPTIKYVDKRPYIENADGSLTPAPGAPDAKPDATVSIPDDAHPGQSIDVSIAQANEYFKEKGMNAKDAAAAITAARADKSGQREDTRLGIENRNADTSQFNADTSRMNATTAQTSQQLQALQDQFNNQIKSGQMTDSEAIAKFDEAYKTLTIGQNAASDAVKYAEMGTHNAVGPGFGEHFSQTLNAIGHGGNPGAFSASDFTYATPDYATIARNAAAEAIAHLSPTAAAMVGAPGPSGYAPQAAAPAQPFVNPNFSANAGGGAPGAYQGPIAAPLAPPPPLPPYLPPQQTSQTQMLVNAPYRPQVLGRG